MSLEFGLLVGAILIYLSILISKTGFKFGIPTLLLFLLVGMAFGTDGIGLPFLYLFIPLRPQGPLKFAYLCN